MCVVRTAEVVGQTAVLVSAAAVVAQIDVPISAAVVLAAYTILKKLYGQRQFQSRKTTESTST